MSQQQKAKGVADMVFLIDATGSMGPCIDALKTNIQTFIGSLTTKDANNSAPIKDWRAKVVGYRDFTCDKVPYVDNPFVDSVEGLRFQLAALQADGGGDEPESLLEALYKLASMPASEKGAPVQAERWRYRSDALRMVIVFTDASFKEPLAEPKGASLDDVINHLMSNRIVLNVFAPEMDCYNRLSELDKSEINFIAGGTTPQESMTLFTKDQANFKKTLEQLAKSVSQSAAIPEA